MKTLASNVQNTLGKIQNGSTAVKDPISAVSSRTCRMAGLLMLSLLMLLVGSRAYGQVELRCKVFGGNPPDWWSEFRNNGANFGFQECEAGITLDSLASLSVQWQDSNNATAIASNSTPAVVGSLSDAHVLYVGSYGTHTLNAYDADGVINCSGGNCSPLWGTDPPGAINYSSDSSPAVARVKMSSDGMVHLAVFFSSGAGLSAFDATSGAYLWSGKIGIGSGNFSSPIISSPMVLYGPQNAVVYVGANDGHVYAFDGTGAAPGCPANCTPLWVSATLSGGNFPVISSPALVGAPVGRLIVVGDQGGITFYYADNNNTAKKAAGDIYWEDHTLGRVESSPIVFGGIVYVGGNLLGLGPHATYSGYLYGLDPATKTRAWTYYLSDPIWASPAVEYRAYVGTCFDPSHCPTRPDDYDILYVAAGKNLYGFDIKNHSNLLVCSGSANNIGDHSSPTTSPDVLLIGDVAGNLEGFDTSQCKTGSPTASINNVVTVPLGTPIQSSPVIANGMAYVNTSVGLFALK